MTIFRNKQNGRLYKMYRVTPPRIIGEWLESEDMITGEVRRLNITSWKASDFTPVAHR